MEDLQATTQLKLKDFIKGFMKDPDYLLQVIGTNENMLAIHSYFLNGYILTSPKQIRVVKSNTDITTLRSKVSTSVVKRYWGKDALVSLDDKVAWEKDRKALAQVFRKEKWPNIAATMVKVINKHFERLDTIIKNGKPFKVDAFLIEVGLDIVLSTIFGAVSLDIKPFPALLKTLRTLSSPRVFSFVKLGVIPMPLYFKFQSDLKKIRAIAEEVVKQAFSDKVNKENVIVYLADAYGYHSYEQLDAKMKSHLIDETILLIAAGYESTVITMTNTITALSLHPLIEAKTREEVNAVLEKRDPSYEDINKLQYLGAVIKEVLRLWPPAILTDRTPIHDVTIDGNLIKKNEMIVLPIYALQRLPKYWDNPLAFDPSRFLKPLTEEQQLLFMPFGIGPRNCFGSHFAITELTLIIAMILQRYRLTLVPGFSLDRKLGNLLYRLPYGLVMKGTFCEN